MSGYYDDEKTHMLPDDCSDASSNDAEIQHRQSRSNRWLKTFIVHAVLIFAQIVFLGFNAFLYFRGSDGPPTPSRQENVIAPFSPASSAITYDIHTIDTHRHSKFTGEPRPELDEAWSELLHATIVRIYPDEMRAMNRTSSALVDGSGYAGYLEAYHMLHCVKRMYQIRHPEYYTTEFASEENFFGIPHWDHCVEVLRQGIMCHADLTINTLFQTSDTSIEGHTTWPRKCTNWDSVKKWAEDRAVQLVPGSQGKLLVPMGNDGEIGPADLL